MKEITVLAEIEHSQELLTPTAYDLSVFMYRLYYTGELLPFMTQDTYNRAPVKANNVIVDQVEYIEFQAINAMRDYLAKAVNKIIGGWVNGGNIIYVCFPSFNPPKMYYSFRNGVLMGFTDNRPVILDGTAYRPGLLSSPRVDQSADALNYKRMIFKTATVTIDNSKGQFDEKGNLFGNEFNLLAGIIPEDERDNPQRKVKLLAEAENKQVVAVKKTDEYITLIGKSKEKPKPMFCKLAQYYIANITAGLETATFHLSDKRERLSAKIPNRQYAQVREAQNETDYFPRIEEKYIGKDMQEAYGRCFGVPGVCLEGTAVLKEGNSDLTMEQYRFRFSSQISRVDRIQVKMTDGEIDGQKIDGWTTVYQLVRPEKDSLDYWPSITTWSLTGNWKPGIDKGSVSSALSAKGEITLSTKVAKRGGNVDSGMHDVRMDGVFNNPGKRDLKKEFVTPLDILKDIMDKYANVPYDRYYIPEGEPKQEIEKELKQLDGYEIGVLFDKSVSVYEAIEKLQGGSVRGFQFCVYKNLFTARLDNPDRPVSSWKIHNKEILNLDKVEIDWNADLYGSYTDIEYAYNYDEGNGKRWIDKTRAQEILDIHRQEKDWSVTTLLAKKEDAQEKSNILLDDFSTLQPLIKNIQFSGEKWFDLRVYDMAEIDFSIPGEEREKYPRHLIRLISEVCKERTRVIAMGQPDEYVTLLNDKKETTRQREFAGNLLCQILRVEMDTSTGVTTIGVRVKGKADPAD